jgi:hypothetical protein
VSNCRLMQYRTANSLCRKCRKPLDVEEPVQLSPATGDQPRRPASAEAGLQVAGQVREVRRARHHEPASTGGAHAGAPHLHFQDRKRQGDSDTGLAGAARPALQVDVRQLIRDARSRRDEEVAAILADPFLAEIAAAAASTGLAQAHADLRRGARCGTGAPAHRIAWSCSGPAAPNGRRANLAGRDSQAALGVIANGWWGS